MLPCWQRVAVPHHMDLAIRLFECPNKVVTSFPLKKGIQESKAEATRAFLT